MKKTIILVTLLATFLNTSLAQQKKCICCTPANKQFDFWIGDWDVYNMKGVKVFESKITSILDSCGVEENCWSTGFNGTSYNYYNPADSTWNQTYIDNSGTALQLKGKLLGTKMILESEKIKSTKADFYYFNRITWEKDSEGNVSQKWDIVNNKGVIMQVAFHGIYKRKKSASKKGSQ